MSKYILKDLKPYEVFRYFEEITRIPRGSGNEKGISDYLVSFAKKNKLEVIQDAALNVIIKKPASPGYENAPAVILQGHIDMVNEKNAGTDHDFDRDSLQLRVVDDMVYASGTTLGADNGIAIAYALAVLSSENIEHPELEVVMTAEEETGMGGAAALDAGNIKGRILINIDSEEEGKLLVSCAGGLRAQVSLPVIWEPGEPDSISAVLRIRGLKGGHSGMEIDKGRGNANKIMARFLWNLSSALEFRLSSLNGGSKMNAIPREADAFISLRPEKVDSVKVKVEEWNVILKNELRASDPGVRVEFEILNEKAVKVFSKETTEKTIKLLYLIPDGVQSMSMDIPGLVESSTNAGVVTTSEKAVNIDSALRSSIRSLKYEILGRIKALAGILGAEIAVQSDYPEWQYNPDSKIRTLFERVYSEMCNKSPEIIAIHAGLECGLFGEKFGKVDMISFGPNIYDVHTPDEHISISSVERTYEYLLMVLKELKQ
jgi:dipeptidase D